MSYSLSRNRFFVSCSFLVLLACTIVLPAISAGWGTGIRILQEAELTGRYSGTIFIEGREEKTDATLEVTATGEQKYEAVLYIGGFPGDQPGSSSEDERKTVELSGEYEDYTLRLTGDFPLAFQFIHNRYTALDEDNNYRGHLEKIIEIGNL